MHDPLNPHSHDPNPEPPSADPSFLLTMPNGRSHTITINDLHSLPQTTVANHYIVSTGHGTSGPFQFAGVTLLDLLTHYSVDFGHPFSVEVISADGFGNRIQRDELLNPDSAGPMLLCLTLQQQPMTREQGLVRLIVPNEKDDALRQVKWVGKINVVQ
ncbi:MAG: molybdopterin-dependent oxidoreductase [Chloroflexota bacterium]